MMAQPRSSAQTPRSPNERGGLDAFGRSAGVLLHPTSLPSRFGIGDLGAGARLFVDWLADAGLKLWQVLPLVPPGAGDSPYATTSALAGNPWLVDLDALVADGLLDAADLGAPAAGFSIDRVDFDAAKAFKLPRLDKAADALWAGGHGALDDALQTFIADQGWVLDMALFLALKADNDGAPWWEWPAAQRDREAPALDAARASLRVQIQRIVGAQFFFERQWQALRGYCADKGVRILGDVPIYVAHDSVDVWANRAQFRLDPDGLPTAVAGVPPDFFSETGQKWGNPLFDWPSMASNGHRWWVARMARAVALTDLVRLDHFRGFSAYWEVPADAEDARTGAWQPGPGTALFEDLRAALGPLPLIAEDLGVIDDAVVTLRETLGLPGMRILQFAFGEGADHAFLPHNYSENAVVYTGTHDNDTSLGWWQDTSDVIQDHVRRYLAVNGHDIVWDLTRAAFASVAKVAIVPMQDVLCLDSRSRMNTPGVADGNWDWRVRGAAFNRPLARRIKGLCGLYRR